MGHFMHKLLLGAVICAALTSNALAVSVGEIISICGDDSGKYCANVGYGDPMQACLEENYAQLTDACKLIVDRIRDGERVTLF